MIHMPEETLLTEVFGNTPMVRVLGLLITGKELDYSISDIVEGATVGWTTLHYVLPRLEKTGIIKNTRNVGRAKMYQINTENAVAQQLVVFTDFLIAQSIDVVSTKKKVPIPA